MSAVTAARQDVSLPQMEVKPVVTREGEEVESPVRYKRKGYNLLPRQSLNMVSLTAGWFSVHLYL